MLCLNHNLHRENGQHYHQPPSHILDTPSLSSWQAGPLRTSWTDNRQTLALFLIRGASYTLIPKPYLENAQVIIGLYPPAKQRQTGKSDLLLDQPRASLAQLEVPFQPWGWNSSHQLRYATHAPSMHLCSAALLYWR